MVSAVARPILVLLASEASGGLVYTGGAGSGGTVYAVKQSTPSIAWTAPVANGDNSSPAASASGVYVSYACGQTYDFSPGTGELIWHRATSCSGGGGKTPVLANGRLYVRDFSFPAILDGASGSVLGPFASSGPAPAVDTSNRYTLSGSTLGAARLSDGATRWSSCSCPVAPRRPSRLVAMNVGARSCGAIAPGWSERSHVFATRATSS